MSERFVAVLQWLGGSDGYGFRVERDGREVLVHYVPVPGEGFRILMEGNKCAFEIVDGPKGLTATNIYQPEPTYRPRPDRAA